MKNKIVGIFVIMLLISSTTTLALTPIRRNEQQANKQLINITSVPVPSSKTNEVSSRQAFTHTIFCELQAATWCPSCPTAVEALRNLYKSHDYQFYYVSLVTDMNSIAKKRARDYIINLKPTYMALPTVYFDGGDKNMPGRLSSVNATAAAYRDILEDVGNRSVTVPIELSSDIVWLGDGKITVTVTITNNGDKPYLGKVRSYVTEIVSRWKDSKGYFFDFGFLDFAINTFIFISAGGTKNISEQWDATQAHGQNFGEISKANIMVISTISHWVPHYRTAYESELGIQKYFAHYVDQTTTATPGSS
jgi:thiol-disulfide isomerase/thioredoxin